LKQRFKQLTGKDLLKDNDRHPAAPRWVAEYPTGKTRWILVQAYEGWNVPDVSFVKLQRFDAEWKYLGEIDFPTGYRLQLTDIKLLKAPKLPVDVIEVKVRSSGPFRLREGEKEVREEDVAKLRELYCVFDDRIALVRLEDKDGDLLRNPYRAAIPFIGPAVPKRTVEQWQQLLHSKQAGEVLEALVWLSGSHLPSNQPRERGVSRESVEDAKRFEEVRDAAGTKKRLEELRKSDNPWIRQAAELASTPIKDDD
jgi:hypothetical protein